MRVLQRISLDMTPQSHNAVIDRLKFTLTPPIKAITSVSWKLMLHCEAQGAIEVDWIRVGKHFPQNHILYPNGTLLLRNISPNDAGSYTCVAKNSLRSVFHRTLPGYLSEDLERLQKRALRIIYPGMSYNQALEFSGLPTLFKRREEISSKLFNEVVGDPGHTLHKLLPSKNPANYFLRRNRNFALPLCKTNRCKKSFIFSHVFCA